MTDTATASGQSGNAQYTATHRRNVRGDVLAYLAVAYLFALTFALLWRSVPDGAGRDLLLILAGVAAGIVKDVYGFEFGSSRGSEAKSDQISNLIKDKEG